MNWDTCCCGGIPLELPVNFMSATNIQTWTKFNGFLIMSTQSFHKIIHNGG